MDEELKEREAFEAAYKYATGNNAGTFDADEKSYVSAIVQRLFEYFQAGAAWKASAQLPSHGGEAVEVVGWLGGNGIHAERQDATGAPFPLMTVAQHQRILAAATHPADQVAGSVARDAERYRLYRLGFEDPEKFDAEIDAALSAKPCSR